MNESMNEGTIDIGQLVQALRQATFTQKNRTQTLTFLQTYFLQSVGVIKNQITLKIEVESFDDCNTSFTTSLALKWKKIIACYD